MVPSNLSPLDDHWFPHNRIQIFPRLCLKASQFASWPRNPQKYLYYTCVIDVEELAPQALDLVRQRTDINCIELEVDMLFNADFWKRLDVIFNMKDRLWAVQLEFPFQSKKADAPTTDNQTMCHAMSVLRNVSYLYVSSEIRRPYSWLQILCNLPALENLRCMEWNDISDSSTLIFSVDELKALYGRAFSPLVRGIPTDALLGNEEIANAVVSKDIYAKQIHQMELSLSNDTVTSDHLTLLQSLPSLKSLTILCFGNVHDEGVTQLFQWLGSSQCFVSDLMLNIDIDNEYLDMLFAALPQLLRLKTLSLQFCSFDESENSIDHWFDSLFPTLSKTLCVESVHLGNEDPMTEEEYQKVLHFQLASRPRLFSVQMLDGMSPGPDTDVSANKIHHVSMLFQVLQDFHQSKAKSSFPLSAWVRVLEKVNVISDLLSTDIQAVGVDARFSVVKELLGDPHRLVNHDGLYERDIYSTSKLASEDSAASKRQRKSY